MSLFRSVALKGAEKCQCIAVVGTCERKHLMTGDATATCFHLHDVASTASDLLGYVLLTQFSLRSGLCEQSTRARLARQTDTCQAVWFAHPPNGVLGLI